MPNDAPRQRLDALKAGREEAIELLTKWPESTGMRGYVALYDDAIERLEARIASGNEEQEQSQGMESLTDKSGGHNSSDSKAQHSVPVSSCPTCGFTALARYEGDGGYCTDPWHDAKPEQNPLDYEPTLTFGGTVPMGAQRLDAPNALPEEIEKAIRFADALLYRHGRYGKLGRESDDVWIPLRASIAVALAEATATTRRLHSNIKKHEERCARLTADLGTARAALAVAEWKLMVRDDGALTAAWTDFGYDHSASLRGLPPRPTPPNDTTSPLAGDAP